MIMTWIMFGATAIIAGANKMDEENEGLVSWLIYIPLCLLGGPIMLGVVIIGLTAK